jgi:transcriptional regulator with XRE-family HTH domain
MRSKNYSEKPVTISEPRLQWAKLLKQTRLGLGETQTQFGQRFDVTAAAVSYWESGTTDIPSEVTWWLSTVGAGPK